MSFASRPAMPSKSLVSRLVVLAVDAEAVRGVAGRPADLVTGVFRILNVGVP